MGKSKNRSRLLILAISVLTILVVAPLSFYIARFGTSNISSDPQSWGMFGDYVGGVLNPIISLASLRVLGYLTHLVALQTSEDGRRLLVLERRMDAYDEIPGFIKPIKSFNGKMNRAMSMLPIYLKLPDDQKLQYTLKMFEENEGVMRIFSRSSCNVI